MDPKELAKMFSDQKGSAEAQRQAEKAAAEESRKQQREQEKVARQALQKIVVPYLDELKKETRGTFDFGMSQELETMLPASVNFVVRQSRVSIQTTLGQVTTTIQDQNARRPEVDETIASVKDLTREKIGALIARLMAKQD